MLNNLREKSTVGELRQMLLTLLLRLPDDNAAPIDLCIGWSVAPDHMNFLIQVEGIHLKPVSEKVTTPRIRDLAS